MTTVDKQKRHARAKQRLCKAFNAEAQALPWDEDKAFREDVATMMLIFAMLRDGESFHRITTEAAHYMANYEAPTDEEMDEWERQEEEDERAERLIADGALFANGAINPKLRKI